MILKTEIYFLMDFFFNSEKILIQTYPFKLCVVILLGASWHKREKQLYNNDYDVMIMTLSVTFDFNLICTTTFLSDKTKIRSINKLIQ